MKRSTLPFALAALVIGFLAAGPARAADDHSGHSHGPPAAKVPAKPAAAAAPQQAAKPAGVDSLALLERAVGRDSTKWENTFRLGVMLLDRDRVAEAARVLERAHKSRPGDVPTLVNLGAAYDAAGNAAQAQVQYRRALELSPDNVMAMCRLAQSLYAIAQHQEAMDLLRDVIQKQAGAHCAYFTMGVAFADAGIYKDAVRMWKKVVELAPDSPEAISAKESISVLESVIKSTN